MVQPKINWYTKMSKKKFPFFELQDETLGEVKASLFKELLNKNDVQRKEKTIKEIFYTQKDLDEAKKIAYEQGLEQGIKQQSLSEEQFKIQALEALNTIIRKIEEIGNERTHTHITDLSNGCAELAFAIANKICDEDGGKLDQNMIKNFISDNVKFFVDEAFITIKLSPQVYSYLSKEIEELCKKNNFIGKITFTVDNNFEPNDCTIEFNDTCIKKSKKYIINTVNSIYNQYVIANDTTSLDNQQASEG